MNSYRLAVNLKLGLIITAVLIAVASLFATNWLTSQLKEREQSVITLYADALEKLYNGRAPINPHTEELRQLQGIIANSFGRENGLGEELSVADRNKLMEAIRWAENMPVSSDEIDFITDNFVYRKWIKVPVIITDSASSEILLFSNIALDSLVTGADSSRVLAMAREMDKTYDPLVIDIDYGDLGRIAQLAHYGESQLVTWLRYFPYIQLLFVSLFILVGYLGFSYVRRNEQSNLWVGMAKEAAHQLGTPISSLMGWSEILRMEDQESVHKIASELDKDVARLQRVANRFSKIGSEPVLETVALAPAIGRVVEYIQRRLPQMSNQVSLSSSIPDDIYASINAELFEWVIENLVKNAIDASEGTTSEIQVVAQELGDKIYIDVIDQGKGISKRDAKNIFRPGYSTKKRGWGLGLSLAKRIAEDYHGGELVLLDSKVGKGTTFRISLDSQS